jgi:hypothetical protein
MCWDITPYCSIGRYQYFSQTNFLHHTTGSDPCWKTADYIEGDKRNRPYDGSGQSKP